MENDIELGSEFNLSLSDLSIKNNNIFSYLSDIPNVVYFNSGRSAIQHIIKHIINQVGCVSDGNLHALLPEFICDSVSNCFQKHSYYKLKEDFAIDVADLEDKILQHNAKIIFLMHYFGTVQPNAVLQKMRNIANKHNCVIIEDTTHSVFSCRQTIGDYIVCSIRKWLPISNGGILYSQQYLGDISEVYDKSTNNDRSYGMILKNIFLKHQDWSISERIKFNKVYREIFRISEEQLDKHSEIQLMSDFSKFIASCVDIYKLVSIRRLNYEFLCEALRNLNVIPAIHIKDIECPLVFLLRVPKRDSLRKYLIDNRIYCAVHWPLSNENIEKYTQNRYFAEKNAKELISLPIDQRYGEAELQYMVKVLTDYRGDLSF